MIDPKKQLERIQKLLEQLQQEGFWGSVELQFNNGNIVHAEMKKSLTAERLYGTEKSTKASA